MSESYNQNFMRRYIKFIYSCLFLDKRRLRNGFTLVELMIALTVTGLIVTAIYSSYIAQKRSAVAQEQVSEMQQSLRAGLGIMEREIRMAGYNPRRTAAVGTGITEATAGRLAFCFVADTDKMNNNPPNTEIDEPDEIETVEYSLYDANGDGPMDLGRRASNRIQAVAENIEKLEFCYIMNDGAQTLDPISSGYANLADIRSVRISILARTSRPDPQFINAATTYKTASDTTWGPFTDNYRRRLLITTIHCRNMGLTP